ncbi:hypothetical protein A2125_01045 [Candidatus Woesebacteria bacterium GWB1_43_5]|uniref:Penicillin-binding protein 2 n=1 Tax=Candidatus Woesebacteria bacterium GWB1_43_5 TaxID=1802474 RepID=A0A1F7WSB7_9BACT|nr:MAG: hypothetical protein A2125_01045 [Candidatus Woesebacteria bacterium GWB1_43_5]
MQSEYDSKGIVAWFFRGILILGITVLLGRLAELQVIKGGYYRELAEGNRIRRVAIAAERGEIHARGGEVLAGSSKVLKKLKFNKESGFETRDVDEDGESGDVIASFSREYKLGKALAHVGGYLGEANEAEVEKINPGCADKGVVAGGSLVGRGGLEEQYECALSGRSGEELFEVDSAGHLVRRLGTRPAQKGENLITNIDFGLQERAAALMEGKRGTVVVTDINGEILALFSSPSYDPNLFIRGDFKEITKLFNDNSKPFFNRAVSGIYHPGSVFKPIVAVAALEEKEIDENFVYEDRGQIVVRTSQGDFSYSNWYFTQYGGVEGAITLKRAIARSTDTFFYKVGEMLGPDKIAEWAKKFGLGEKTGIDIPGEVAGLIPTPQWKKEVKGENWFLGNTYHFSIGQGDLGISPISINMATAAIASGKLCKPAIVGESECKSLDVDRQHLQLVKKGMTDACSEGGTASIFFDFLPKVACKTGTAETGANNKTHAWFTLIAPAESDNANQIVMTVLVEEGGEGSVVAAPIAKDLLTYWLSNNEN